MKYGARQTDSEIRVRRSVARLLSLADRVERSCFQFVLIRVFLLWLLRPAERRVRCLVLETADEAGLAGLPELLDVFEAADSGQLAHNSAQEALDMALRLRALAALWAWLHGLDAATGRVGDDLFWANYWRHIDWLATALQADALLRLSPMRAGQILFQRPEVRSPGGGADHAQVVKFAAKHSRNMLIL